MSILGKGHDFGIAQAFTDGPITGWTIACECGWATSAPDVEWLHADARRHLIAEGVLPS